MNNKPTRKKIRYLPNYLDYVEESTNDKNLNHRFNHILVLHFDNCRDQRISTEFIKWLAKYVRRDINEPTAQKALDEYHKKHQKILEFQIKDPEGAEKADKLEREISGKKYREIVAVPDEFQCWLSSDLRKNPIDCQIGFIPESITKFKNLKHLTFNDNKFEKIPDCILELKNLKYLSAHNNQIKKIPAGLFDLPHLYEVVLYSNQIREIPKNIASAKSLRYLSLMNNKITSIPEEILEVKKLIKFDIRFNKFLKIMPEIAESLKSVEQFLFDGKNLVDNMIVDDNVDDGDNMIVDNKTVNDSSNDGDGDDNNDMVVDN